MGAANVKAAEVNENQSDGLYLESKSGTIRKLPGSLYEELSDQSETYSLTRNFIGYVDPKNGVVLVDSSKLEEEYNRSKKNVADHAKREKLKNPPAELPGLIRSNSTSFLNDLNGILLDGDTTRVANKHKTMHQLAYERINGVPLPEDETRPISGFAIKEGRLVFNSSTYNSFEDEFHSADREMNALEINKLNILLAKLNERELEKQRETSF